MIVLFNIFPKQKNKLDLTSTFTPIFSLDFLTHSLKSSTTAHTLTFRVYELEKTRERRKERRKEGKKERRKEKEEEEKERNRSRGSGREWAFLKLFSVI